MTEDKSAQTKVSWGIRRRLDFIDFRLMWNGRINRSDIMERFDISSPQATADLDRYSAQAPDNLEYDAGLKAYKRLPGYQPKFVGGQVDRHLLQMRALRMGWLELEQSYFDKPPSTEVATLQRRPLDDEVLMPIIDAVRLNRCVEVTYWTMSGKPASARLLAPHSFAFGTGRWHIRAWNAENGDFRDFNLGRIEKVVLRDASPVDPRHDLEWHNIGKLHLRANPALDAEEQASIRREFTFDGETLVLSCRLALLFYLRAEYGLVDETLPPYRRPLILENAAELEEFRLAARKMSVASLNSATPDD